MGTQDIKMLHDSGAITPPGTPHIKAHSKSSSTSSDFLSSLSDLRRGSSVSSRGRPRLDSLESTPQPGSTELITFPHNVRDYEICKDDRGRKKKIGEGAWSDVYLATPCLPKPASQTSSQTPYNPDMTPPLTPVRGADSSASLTKLPPTPILYAVKVPAMTSAKKVLGAEARILSYLTRFPDAEHHIVSFYGLDTRNGSLLLRAMDDTLEGWLQKHLNTLDEPARAEKLTAIFPRIALALIDSLIWMQDKHCTHGDIKPSNILVSTPPSSLAPKPLYSDFSSTTLTLPNATIDTSTSPLGAGTWDYLDPSLLTSTSTALPSHATDLWSLAITLLFVVLGASPYDAFRHNKYQQREMIKSGWPLQCLGYDEQGMRNMQRIKALERGLRIDVMAWFGMVLVKEQEKRVGVLEWRRGLTG
ncbi:hypothetical protein COCMIDRAFT_41073 [Bipolaris oryzae ATCC 44560]|uniref:non-specific serine/threonine protein kinase n=1 Tax=Bipolaris oryzae ATCC 44560 TaxID=930090 RepID=W6YSM3_COCMI|nr:uncharacterized protein COCMIDRAFT_41073 [Bipolaris oryzae ATCC 44560]EUC40625.1 hypothetical protein COCMIDRAFT_41073 [Bipolaris oryzae ATCC 44560]